MLDIHECLLVSGEKHTGHIRAFAHCFVGQRRIHRDRAGLLTSATFGPPYIHG